MEKLVRDALIKSIRYKYRQYGESFSEKQMRIWAACEARQIGRGGVTYVHEATGLSRNSIHKGLSELTEPKKKELDRIQKARGRKKTINCKPA
jgi:hypothetical protein